MLPMMAICAARLSHELSAVCSLSEVCAPNRGTRVPGWKRVRSAVVVFAQVGSVAFDVVAPSEVRSGASQVSVGPLFPRPVASTRPRRGSVEDPEMVGGSPVLTLEGRALHQLAAQLR